MSRPPAKWKVEYEAKVAAMSNADLLTEATEIAILNGSDYADGRSQVKDQLAQSELTRRLTAIGFLPPAPANDTEGWIGVIQQKRPLPPVSPPMDGDDDEELNQ